MRNLILASLLLSYAYSHFQVLSDALHHSMGPKFGLTFQEITDHPCSYFRQVTGVDTSIDCEVVDEEQDEFGRMIRLTQSIEGVRIQCADIRVNINKKGHTTINGEYFVNPPELNTLILQTKEALARTQETVTNGEHFALGLEAIDDKLEYQEPQLVITCPRNVHTDKLRLGYKTKIQHSENYKSGHIFVDGETGEHIKTHTNTKKVSGITQTSFYGRRSIQVTSQGGMYYSFQNSPRNIHAADCTISSGGICPYMSNSNRNSFGSTTDEAKLMAAYWGAEEVYDFISSQFGRTSYDGQGSTIEIAGIDEINAYWSQSTSSGRASFGFKNNINLSSLEIVGHQITHGIVGTTASMIYQDESGAIEEAIADLIGLYCYQKILNLPNTWDVGLESTYVSRSLSNPKQNSDPDTYQGTYWYTGTDDNGGVHTNSGALNHAFYLMAEGGSGSNDNGNNYTVVGFGIDKVAQIIYRALTRYFTQNSQYSDARTALSFAASDLYGCQSSEQYNTERAMYAIGVGTSPILTAITCAPDGASYLIPLCLSVTMGLIFILFL